MYILLGFSLITKSLKSNRHFHKGFIWQRSRNKWMYVRKVMDNMERKKNGRGITTILIKCL